MEGWIKIHRGIIDHWIWKNPAYYKAWVTMLFLVNYEEKKVLIGSQIIICKRGQSVFSINTWSETFGNGWSYQKVRTFFDLLENDNMISRISTNKTTILTICNYDKYQDYQQANNKQITNKQQTNNEQITTTKESKESKEIKNNTLPDFEEFKNYALEKEPLINLKSLEMKYESWKLNGWKNGNGKPIKNWKSNLLNTIPFLIKDSKNGFSAPKKQNNGSVNAAWKSEQDALRASGELEPVEFLAKN